LFPIGCEQLLNTVYEQEPYHAQVAVSHNQDGCSVAFRMAAEFLGEFLPLSARATASTVRNRVLKVGRNPAAATSKEPCKELVVGFDGGYVRNRHRRRSGVLGMASLSEESWRIVESAELRCWSSSSIIVSCKFHLCS
jgi:hypothetical protein